MKSENATNSSRLEKTRNNSKKDSMTLSKINADVRFHQQQLTSNISYEQRLKLFNPDLSNYHNNPFSGLFQTVKPELKRLLKNVFMALIKNHRKLKILSSLTSSSLENKHKNLPPFLDFNQRGFISLSDLKHFGTKMGAINKTH